MMNNTLLVVIISAPLFIAALFFLFRFLLKLTIKPVLEINLTPSDNPRWSDTKKIEERMETFRRNGFELAGIYECWEIPGLIIAGYVKPSEQLVGVINDHSVAGIWEDVCVQYTDGENLTVSNAPKGQEMDHMPESTMIYMKGSFLDELMARVLAERKNKARKTIAKEEFSSNFEEAYKKQMKWRMERGGPTALEVKRVADEMGVPLDSEKMQAKTQKLQEIWMEEKNKPQKVSIFEAELPGEFQRPDTFRQRMEEKSSPMPQMKFQPLPVYTILILALVCLCYYGYQYYMAHGRFPFATGMAFLMTFLVLFVALMSFRQYFQNVVMCATLKRLADMRSGAFVFISGKSPTLFYAREGWLGKVVFLQKGGEYQESCTRLEAVTKHSGGWVSINRKDIISRIFSRSDKENIPLPDGDFAQKYTLSGTDKALAQKLLNSSFPGSVLQLEQFNKPFVDVDEKKMVVEVSSDLYSPRKEAELRKFLELAENIVDTVVPQS